MGKTFSKDNISKTELPEEAKEMLENSIAKVN